MAEADPQTPHGIGGWWNFRQEVTKKKRIKERHAVPDPVGVGNKISPNASLKGASGQNREVKKLAVNLSWRQ